MGKITIGRRLNQSTDSVTVKQGAVGTVPWPVRDMAKVVPVEFDHVDLTYDPVHVEDVTRAVYRTGGPTGAVVATVDIGYNSGRNIISVTRT